MYFYIILDTQEEIISNDKLSRLRWEYEAQKDLLTILFTKCPVQTKSRNEQQRAVTSSNH